MPKPILPTRVFPAGESLPVQPATAPSAPPSPPPPPTRPPAVPFWPPPPPPEPAATIVHVHVLLPEAIAPEPEPSWSWARIWVWLQPRRNAVGMVLGFIPGLAWGRALSATRTTDSISVAWILATIALVIALTADRWRRRWYSRGMVWAAVIGAYAMANPYDVVTLFTGVHL